MVTSQGGVWRLNRSNLNNDVAQHDGNRVAQHRGNCLAQYGGNQLAQGLGNLTLELARMVAAVENNRISSVVVPSMSRLAKSSKHLLSLLQLFEKKGIRFISLKDKIDTETTKAFNLLSVLSSIVQFENDLSSARTKMGLHQARLEGKLIGRKKKRDSELIRKLLKTGMTMRQIAAISKSSQGSVFQEKQAMMAEETNIASY